MRSPIIFLLLLTFVPLFGQTPVIVGPNQKFIHYTDHNAFVLIETLEPGITLYSLSRKYNLTVEQILASNPDIRPDAIPLGYPVNIPVHSDAISFEPPGNAEERIWLSYRVQPKETLYRISKVYLNVSPDVITTLNPSALSGLSIGQVLHVGWLLPSKNSSCPVQVMDMDSSRLKPQDYMKVALDEGKVIHHQKGLAVWKPGAMTSHYYVLHPTAKLGSFMEITNPMLHRTITAKVAGHIPPGLYQSHVGIVVSPSTARALGVLDQQFFARWRYVE